MPLDDSNLMENHNFYNKSVSIKRMISTLLISIYHIQEVSILSRSFSYELARALFVIISHVKLSANACPITVAA